jgi:hypothetical protein
MMSLKQERNMSCDAFDSFLLKSFISDKNNNLNNEMEYIFNQQNFIDTSHGSLVSISEILIFLVDIKYLVLIL